MPFESQAQNRWAHTPAGTQALGGAAKVKEWEKATDYSHLPERATVNKGHMSKTEQFAKGGAVLGRTRDFLKEHDGEDQNTVPRAGANAYKNPDLAEQDYAKADKGAKGEDGGAPKQRGKVLPTVRPRT